MLSILFPTNLQWRYYIYHPILHIRKLRFWEFKLLAQDQKVIGRTGIQTYVHLTQKLVIWLLHCITAIEFSVFCVFLYTNDFTLLSRIQQYEYCFSAVSSRVPTGSNSSSQNIECLTPEPCSQSPSNVASQSIPPVYPSVDIDAHVSRLLYLYLFFAHSNFLWKGKDSLYINCGN